MVRNTGLPGETLAAELAAGAARGERLKYLYFWGHRPQRDGSVGRAV
ncbi:hypothetical protein SXIM_06110 [Streptomyces xiamenensis]|uniref:Uncharacterized protein n=1 Tax=Streptomyces xiamenensis TaxID=408015 RepID=A0A0F7FPQ4_9ACTN|nr:hypothetical protein SXIM_06110 [Streptomyces xiamenensis]